MGRIKTQPVKRATHELMEAQGDKFTEDFSSNKGVVDQYLDVSSKKLRNVIAGYVSRLKKKEHQPVRMRQSTEETGFGDRRERRERRDREQ